LWEPKIATLVNVHEHGRTLALVAVGDNRIGKLCSLASPPLPIRYLSYYRVCRFRRMSFAAHACCLSSVLLAVLFEGARQRTTSDGKVHFFITCHLLRRSRFGGYGHHPAQSRTSCSKVCILDQIALITAASPLPPGFDHSPLSVRDQSRCMRLHFTGLDFNNMNLRTRIRREEDFISLEA
jgi:hypothetical protein